MMLAVGLSYMAFIMLRNALSIPTLLSVFIISGCCVLSNVLLGSYPKNPETPIQKNLCTPMFIAAQFTIAKCWKQPKCPSVNEWIEKLWYIYTMEYYAAKRKKELLPFTTTLMELESIMLSVISQMVNDKYHMISPISGT